jgi:hypothetical protein
MRESLLIFFFFGFKKRKQMEENKKEHPKGQRFHCFRGFFFFNIFLFLENKLHENPLISSYEPNAP